MSLTPRQKSLALIFLIVAAFFIGRAIGRHPPTWYPKCPVYAYANLYCPGCGSARTLHDLAHGQVAAAITHNVLITLILVPLLAFYLAVTLYRGLFQNRPPPALPNRSALIMLIVILLFTIARNIPLYPFTLLAPH